LVGLGSIAVNVFFDFERRPTYTFLGSAAHRFVLRRAQDKDVNHMAKATKPPSLSDLRAEIDRIDEAMHGLLIERGGIIENLIAVKRTQESGSAFRPAREAAMMRKLVERHHGILPLETVESIWRVIIATFTHVQAPYSVHADLTPGKAAVRDSARFHFGFTAPLVTHLGAASVVEAVSESKGDLGLVPAFAAAGGAWWSALEFESAPKIIARLPFVERADHPAALPLFVVSHVAPDAMVTEVAMWSLRVSGWNAALARAVSAFAELIAIPDQAFDGAALLVSVPAGHKLEEITKAVVKAGASLRSSALVGSHATRYTVPA
jgi:chorismate mutase